MEEEVIPRNSNRGEQVLKKEEEVVKEKEVVVEEALTALFCPIGKNGG